MSYNIRKGGGLFGVIVILIFTLAITTDIVKKIIKRVQEGRNSSDKTSMDIVGMIYIDLFIILGHIILVTFNFAFSSNETDCKLITKICTVLFHGSRCILYLIFVRRLQVIYGDTMFALSKLHTYLLYVIITIYSIPYIAYFNWNFIDTKYDEQIGCLVQYKPSIYLLIVYILHIVIATYCFYLFVYPLYRLIKAQENEQNSKLYNVMIKFSILYSSSIYSSWTLIIISYLLPFGYNYSMIDNFINGMILILLHPINNKLYKSICCLSHSLCTYICDAPNDEEEIKPNIINRKISVAVTKPTTSVQDIELNKQQKDVSSEIETSDDTINAITTIRAYKDRVNRKFSDCSASPSSPSPRSPPLRPITWQITDQSIKSNTITSLRDVMKDRVKRKISIDVNDVNIPQSSPIYTCSPSPPSPPSPSLRRGHFAPIEFVRTCSALQNDDIVVITLKNNKQTQQKTDTIHRVKESKLKSFPSIRSLKEPKFEEKKSNTLEFINYESTKL